MKKCRPRKTTDEVIDRAITAGVSLDDMENRETIARAMTLAGIEPGKIYAFRKTGLILVENRDYPPDVLDAWCAAIVEYETGQLVGAAGGGQ